MLIDSAYTGIVQVPICGCFSINLQQWRSQDYALEVAKQTVCIYIYIYCIYVLYIYSHIYIYKSRKTIIAMGIALKVT